MQTNDLRQLAVAHRHANWGVITGFIGAITHWYVAFAVVPYLVYCTWRLGKTATLGVAARITTLLLMLIPVANVLVLALISHHAGKELKRAGLRVGPFGVKTSDLPASNNVA